MGCVFFAKRGVESIYRLGISASSETERMSLVLKDTEFKFHRAIDTDSPSDCEKLIEGYFASHNVSSDPTLFSLAAEEIERAVEVAESFVAKFLPLRKAVQALANRSTDRKYSVPSMREMQIYKKLKRVREEEFRLQLRREYLENELKAVIGTSAGLQGIASWSSQTQRRFDNSLFKSENPDLYAAYQKEKTARVFRLH